MKIKKLILLLLTFVLAFSTASLFGCGGCKHKYEYSCDAVNHWKECVYCNEIEKDSIEAHAFTNLKCATCTQAKFTEGLTFEKIVDGEEVTYYVKKYTGTDTVVDIPTAICGKAVTGIRNEAFKDCTALTNVMLPDGLIYVGDNAFDGCTSLQGYADGTITYLGNEWNHFIYLHSSTDNTITSATIKDGCKIVGSNAFKGHRALKGITIPDSVTCFCKDAFSGCLTAVLSNVNFLGTIDQWAEMTISEPSANPIWYSKKLLINGSNIYDCTITVPYIKPFTFFECDNIRNLTLAEGVKRVGVGAFQGCNSHIGYNGDYTYYFTSLTLPSSLEVIDYAAFKYCANINTLYIPKNIKVIGASAFEGCIRMGKIMFEGTKEEFKDIEIKSNCFARVKAMQLQCSDGAIVIDKDNSQGSED